MKIGNSALGVAVAAILAGGLTAGPAHADDVVAPDAVITAPALQDEVYGRKALTFSGTATDDTGVASVGIAFQDRKSRLWFRPDGTWGAYQRYATVLSQPGTVKTNWSYTWTPPSAGSYVVQAVAKDKAGHPDKVLPFRRFEVDTAAPDTTIKIPTGATTQIRKGRSATISGTARDDHGVLNVYEAIENRATHKWLRPGGVWGAIYWHKKSVVRPGAPGTDWSFGQSFSTLGTFTVQVRASDRAGLADPTPASRTFKVVR
ncbi:Ig-like domain-containing protein [Actinomadura roseirufa]|uniref:Ig-like domain-containing protein n=1 Tax=Actinomadura roseirufa TaxID=2094049 RepID=UPI001041443D|nr:Ig-like domain-containing protein [Actinomadura roseirufa]